MAPTHSPTWARPRWSTPRTTSRPTYGPAVARVAQGLGYPFIPWQQEVADVTGEVLPNGRMAYPVVVMIVQRRAGKTLLSLATNIQRAASAPGVHCWYTAQTGSDAATTFRDDWVPKVDTSAYAGHIKARKSNGSQALVLPNTSRFGLFAPTESALHGQYADTVTIDESWWFDQIKGSQLEAAVRPAMLTRPLRQLFIISAGGTTESEWLLNWQKVGRALDGATDQGIAYFEWFPPEGADLDSPETWATTHPALGYHVDLDILREDHASFKKQGKLNLFYRSYLNVFTEPDDSPLFPPPERWASMRDLVDQAADHAVTPGPGMFAAYSVSGALDSGSIALARRPGPGLPVVVELVDQRPGTEWMWPELARIRTEYRAELVADAVGPETTVTRQLRDQAVPVTELGTRDYLDACAEFLRDIADPSALALRRSPSVIAAARTTARRDVGDAWAYSARKSGADIAPVKAVTIAAFKARHHIARAPFIRTSQDRTPVGPGAVLSGV